MSPDPSIYDHCHDPFCFINRNGYLIDVEHARQTVSESEYEFFLPTLTQLDGKPVCWLLPQRKTVVDWMTVCNPQASITAKEEDMSPQGVKRRIFAAWSNDNRLTKNRIKHLVAPSQSVRRFDLGWKLAAEEIPAITKIWPEKEYLSLTKCFETLSSSRHLFGGSAGRQITLNLIRLECIICPLHTSLTASLERATRSIT